MDKSTRAARVGETRELILAAAERLYAEHGVYAVSNRQVGEAAGQGNNFAVGYHFGTKTDLVRAIVARHAERIEHARQQTLAQADGANDVRSWVARLVRPSTEHFATLGVPSWFARFSAQMMTEPTLRDVIYEEALSGPGLLRIIDGLNQSLPAVPLSVRAERSDMARNLIVHMCAEHERALADGTPTGRPDWRSVADGLIDAITGLLLAPVTHHQKGTQ